VSILLELEEELLLLLAARLGFELGLGVDLVKLELLSGGLIESPKLLVDELDELELEEDELEFEDELFNFDGGDDGDDGEKEDDELDELELLLLKEEDDGPEVPPLLLLLFGGVRGSIFGTGTSSFMLLNNRMLKTSITTRPLNIKAHARGLCFWKKESFRSVESSLSTSKVSSSVQARFLMEGPESSSSSVIT
jgi:hypothetical protein